MPEILGPCVGVTGVVCGALILFGLLMRYSIIPLSVIMLIALVSTKVPILLGHDVFGFALKPLPRYGVLSMLHEARTDICLMCGLIYLWLIPSPSPANRPREVLVSAFK